MNVEFFTVPVFDNERERRALNAFLSSHALRDMDRKFVDAGVSSFWAISVVYDAKRPSPSGRRAERVDYREVLSPKDFDVFAKLRSVRKEHASRDAVPAYHIATDRQLADLVRKRVMTRREMSDIDGMGPARLTQYGDALLDVLVDAVPRLDEAE